MRITNQAEIRTVRFREEVKEIVARVIIHEEAEEQGENDIADPEEAKRIELEENNKYFLGYFKWYWD